MGESLAALSDLVCYVTLLTQMGCLGGLAWGVGVLGPRIVEVRLLSSRRLRFGGTESTTLRNLFSWGLRGTC